MVDFESTQLKGPFITITKNTLAITPKIMVYKQYKFWIEFE